MRYTEEQMNIVIKEWQQSGLSKKAFCHQRGITNSTFHYWLKRFSGSGGFAEVKVRSSSHCSSNACEVVFPSGVRMMFSEQPSVQWLRELVC
jgi:transposase-like protein